MEYRNPLLLKCAAFVMAALIMPKVAAASLDAAIEAAIENDPWLVRSLALERALQTDAMAAGALPDPSLSASLANLPTDTFDLSQEPMTQLIVGVSQRFPSGQARQLRRRRLEQMSASAPIDRLIRRAVLRRDITLQWIDAGLAQETIRLIDDERILFEQLEGVTRASYGAGSGKTSQQNLVRVQLELTRLDERLLLLEDSLQQAIAALSEWVPGSILNGVGSFDPVPGQERQVAFPVDHPEIQGIDQQIKVAEVEVRLADAARRPGWSLHTQYGLRDEDRLGRELPDFVSVRINLDLPLFPRNRQNKQVAAAAERVAASRSERLLRLRELDARYTQLQRQLQRLNQQQSLYVDMVVPQVTAMAEAALNAYTSDRGDFAEVMRAHIDLLNTRIEVMRIGAERQKTIAKIDYHLTRSPS